MSEHIYSRLKVSKTHGVKLCLFCEQSITLYDRHTWSIINNSSCFYLVRSMSINGTNTLILFHRELLALKDGEIYDHKNGNGLDNRIKNLRPATHGENMCNQVIYKNNTSGVKGVSWHIRNKKWCARIQCDEVPLILGYFDDIKEAEKVVRAKREELHGEFCNHG